MFPALRSERDVPNFGNFNGSIPPDTFRRTRSSSYRDGDALDHKDQSEWRESNPRSCLGKAEHYHYATLAYKKNYPSSIEASVVLVPYQILIHYRYTSATLTSIKNNAS